MCYTHNQSRFSELKLKPELALVMLSMIPPSHELMFSPWAVTLLHKSPGEPDCSTVVLCPGKGSTHSFQTPRGRREEGREAHRPVREVQVGWGWGVKGPGQ